MSGSEETGAAQARKGLRIYGASDDLIELEGDISDEFGCYNPGEDGALLTLSDGTAIAWTYNDDGIWKAEVLAKGPLFGSIEPCCDSDADPNSDVVTMLSGVKRAWLAKEWEASR